MHKNISFQLHWGNLLTQDDRNAKPVLNALWQPCRWLWVRLDNVLVLNMTIPLCTCSTWMQEMKIQKPYIKLLGVKGYDWHTSGRSAGCFPASALMASYSWLLHPVGQSSVSQTSSTVISTSDGTMLWWNCPNELAREEIEFVLTNECWYQVTMFNGLDWFRLWLSKRSRQT